MQANLFYFSKPSPSRPAENKYVVEIEGMDSKSFSDKNVAILFMFDKGVNSYKYYTKEISAYKNLKQVPTIEIWQVGHRIGTVTYGDEFYTDENNEVKKRKSFVWRFVGFGKPCFAPTTEELREKVWETINRHLLDPDERGLNKYPYFTQFYR